MKKFFVTALSIMILIGLGKTVKIGPNVYLKYNGMISKEVYALSSVKKGVSEPNTFYPVRYSQILYKDYVLQVVKIQPYFITFDNLGKEK